MSTTSVPGAGRRVDGRVGGLRLVLVLLIVVVIIHVREHAIDFHGVLRLPPLLGKSLAAARVLGVSVARVPALLIRRHS